MVRWCLVLALPLLLGGPARSATRYRLTDLGVTGAESSFAVAVNNHEGVIGYSNYPSSDLHPWVWNRREAHEQMGFVGEVISINDRGWIAGTVGMLPNFQPFVNEGGDQTLSQANRTLSLPHMGNGYATAMNNKGEITGVMTAGFIGLGGFLWRHGSSVSLNGSGIYFPYGINDEAAIVGMLLVGGSFRAAKWVDGQVTIIDLTGSGPSSGYAINMDGMVVGSAADQAFVWTQKGGLINITPFAGSATAIDVNGLGQVVGSADGLAFLWEKGVLHLLNDLVEGAAGWRFDWASGINELGQIVGTATYGGLLRAFLLTPVD